MIPLLAMAASPLIKSLMEKGLSAIAGAVANKGKEYVETKFGIKLEDSISDATATSLRELEIEHSEFLTDAALEGRRLDLEEAKVAQGAVTSRWEADMHSDSWLSKNIRPLTLLFLLGIYTLLSIASGFGFNVTQAYVELLGTWGQLVMLAYFAGRSVEKVINVKESSK